MALNKLQYKNNVNIQDITVENRICKKIWNGKEKFSFIRSSKVGYLWYSKVNLACLAAGTLLQLVLLFVETVTHRTDSIWKIRACFAPPSRPAISLQIGWTSDPFLSLSFLNLGFFVHFKQLESSNTWSVYKKAL